MNDLLGVIAAAIGAFAGTNVDDIVVLAVLFSASERTGRPARWQIWGGQYLGIGLLIAAAVLAALGLTIVPDRWVGLLGLVPLGLGIRGIVETVRARGAEEPPRLPAIATSVVAVSAITIANGADNIAIYTPLFRSISSGDGVVTVVVFLVLVAVWLIAGTLLGSHRRVTAFIERWGHWVVPAVFVGIGCLILYESHVLGRIADLF